MKYLHLALAVLFLLFAYWQLNDLDPARWVAMYGFVAVTAAWSYFRRPPYWWPWIGLGVAIVWLITLVPDFINWIQMGSPTITGQMKAESPHVELTREFLGLAICISALIFYVRLERRQGKT